ALPRCERRRLPIALRRLRPAGRRGDGLRRAGRRLLASLARRGVRRRRGAFRPARPGRDREWNPYCTHAARATQDPRSRARAVLHVARERPRPPAGVGFGSSEAGPMRPALDVTPLRLTRAGTARYIRNLLERLEVETVEFGGPGRAAVLARELWWYPLRLSAVSGVDLLHCTTYYGPVRPRIPTVVTVHDLAVLRHPEAFPRWTRTYVPRVLPHVLRAARRVIAVSEFTASELEVLLRVPREKIRIVPNGVDASFAPEGPRADGAYLLAVGTLEPRKNLARAIEAATLVGVELRVVGARGWGGVDASGPNVTWLGEVD